MKTTKIKIDGITFTVAFSEETISQKKVSRELKSEVSESTAVDYANRLGHELKVVAFPNYTKFIPA